MAKYSRLTPHLDQSLPPYDLDQRHRVHSGTMKGFDQSAAEVPLYSRYDSNDGRDINSSAGSDDPKASGNGSRSSCFSLFNLGDRKARIVDSKRQEKK